MRSGYKACIHGSKRSSAGGFQKVQKSRVFGGGEKYFFCNGPSGPFSCQRDRKSRWILGINRRDAKIPTITHKDRLTVKIQTMEKWKTDAEISVSILLQRRESVFLRGIYDFATKERGLRTTVWRRQAMREACRNLCPRQNDSAGMGC